REELVASLEYGMIRAAGESAVLLVAQPERHERGLLELRLEFALGPIVEDRQRFGKARHFECALAKVVRLLGVEKQNAMRNFRFRHDERDDRLRAELLHRAKSVIAVRRPVFTAARGHGDHGIEIPIELVDRIRDASDVRLGEIALERRRLDDVDRQRGEELPVSAEWIAIR